MSPTEDDLRAALRRGEGEAPDARRVVARAEAARARRRAQVRSGVLGVVVVAAVGGAGAALLDAGRGGDSTSSSARGSAATGAASGAAASSAAAAAGGALPPRQATGGVRACPTSVPHYLLPGGGSPGRFGSGGPLFAAPVASALVCDYGTGNGAAHRIVLDGARARELAASMEAARTRPAAGSCAGPYRPTRRIAVLAVTSAGRQLPVVTAAFEGPPCSSGAQVTTNGTAVRYGWTPPAGVLGVLPAATSPTASQAHGSPIRS